jgi:hypothetical protein
MQHLLWVLFFNVFFWCKISTDSCRLSGGQLTGLRINCGSSLTTMSSKKFALACEPSLVCPYSMTAAC